MPGLQESGEVTDELCKKLREIYGEQTGVRHEERSMTAEYWVVAIGVAC